MAEGVLKTDQSKTFVCSECYRVTETLVTDAICPECGSSLFEELTSGETSVRESAIEHSADVSDMTLARAIVQAIVRLLQTSPPSTPSFDGHTRSSSPRNQTPFQSAYVANQSSHRFHSKTHVSPIEPPVGRDPHSTISATLTRGPAVFDGHQSSSWSLTSSELLLPWTPEARLSEESLDATSSLAPTVSETASLNWYTSLLTHQHSTIRSQARPLFNGLSIFDAAIGLRHVAADTGIAASRHSEDQLEGLQSPLLERLNDGLGLAASQDEHRDEHLEVIVNFERDGPTHGLRRVPELDQATQALRNFFIGRPIVLPFGNSRIYLHSGIASPALHQSVSTSYGSPYSVFDRLITQLMNQMDTGPAPASQTEIEVIPFININSDHLANTHSCAICIEDYVLSESVRQLICGHFFHSDCIVRWLQMHGTCPVCRSRLTGFVRPPQGNQLTQMLSDQLPNEENEDWVSMILDDVTDAFLSSNSPTVALSDAGSLSSQWFTTGQSVAEQTASVDFPLRASREPTPVPPHETVFDSGQHLFAIQYPCLPEALEHSLDPGRRSFTVPGLEVAGGQEHSLDSDQQSFAVPVFEATGAREPNLDSGQQSFIVPGLEAAGVQLPVLNLSGNAVLISVVEVDEAGVTTDGGLHLRLFT